MSSFAKRGRADIRKSGLTELPHTQTIRREPIVGQNNRFDLRPFRSPLLRSRLLVRLATPVCDLNALENF